MQIKRLIQIAAGDLASKIVLVGINLYLIRQLAIDQYSHFTLLLNAALLGYQLACGPIERLYIAEHERYGRHLITLQWSLSCVSALLAVVWLRNKIGLVDGILMTGGIFLLAAYQVMRIRFQQKQDFFYFSLAEALKNGIWFLLVFAVPAVGLMNAGSAAFCSLLVGTLFAFLALKITIGSRLPPLNSSRQGREVITMLWDARYVVSYSLVGAVVAYLPVIMIGANGSNEVIATYGAAMRYQAILGMAVYAFNTALLPHIASLEGGLEQQQKLLKQLKNIVVTALPIFLVCILALWWAVPYIDKGKYPLLQSIFLIMAVTPVMSFISAPFVNTLLVSGRARTILVCMSLGTMVTVLSFLAFRQYSAIYAPGLASLLGYTTITCGVVSSATIGMRKTAVKVNR